MNNDGVGVVDGVLQVGVGVVKFHFDIGYKII